MRNTSVRSLALFALLLAASASGCASQTGPVRELPEGVQKLLGGAPAEYAAPEGRVRGSPDAGRLRVTFEGVLRAETRGSLQHEAALDLAAEAIAEATAGGTRPVPQAIMEWILWRSGATSRLARADVLASDDPGQLDLRLREVGERLQPAMLPQSYGLARAGRGSQKVQVVLIARQALAVEPFPKAHAPGATLAIKGRMRDAYSALVLHADTDAAAPRAEPIRTAPDGSFSIALPLPQKPGRYFVEVTGVEPRAMAAQPDQPWRRSLLWVPVYVGVPEPSAPDEVFRSAPVEPPDPQAWSARILEIYNAERARAGKQPLGAEGRLTTLAQARSAIFAPAEREPPTDPALADKLATAGLPPREYEEYHQVAETASDYARMRLLQPSARQHLLSSDTTSIAIGVTPSATMPGRRDVVEISVDPIARLDPVKDRSAVQEAFDALRKADGKPAYLEDEDVSKAVQAFADEVCRGLKKPNQTKILFDKARGVGEKYKTWAAAQWRVIYDFNRWKDPAVLAKLREPAMSYVAVGLCQGNLPGKPGASYLAVVQFGP